MLFYILISIYLSIGIPIIYMTVKDDVGTEKAPIILICIFILPAIYFICFPFSIHQGSYNLHHKEKAYEIVSLNTKSKSSGSFILGSGHVNEEEYYYSFAEVEVDTYKRVTIPTTDALILETDEKEPHVKKFYYTQDYHNWVIPEWIVPNKIEKTEYHIYVPKGTVIKDFEVK